MGLSDSASDPELIDQARAGDPSAFGLLVKRHEGAVRRLARSWSATDDDADDLAQTTFLKAYRDLRQLDDPARFRPWILRIVLNAARDSRRRSVLRPFQRAESLDSDPGDAAGAERSDPPAPASSDPGRQVVGLEMRRALEIEMQRLPPDLRMALDLHVGEGMKHDEIAKLAGCSESTVRWRLFQARRILRTALDAHLRT